MTPATRMTASRLGLFTALAAALFGIGFLALPIGFTAAISLAGLFGFLATLSLVSTLRDPRREGQRGTLQASRDGLSFEGEAIGARAARVMGNVVHIIAARSAPRRAFGSPIARLLSASSKSWASTPAVCAIGLRPAAPRMSSPRSCSRGSP